MPVDHFRKSLDKFEEHAALRQRMFETAKVNLGRGRIPPAHQSAIRSAMILCFECDHTAACQIWLDAAEDGTSPPEFCQLRQIISRLKSSM